MATPLETRNEHLANHLIKQLKKRNMEAVYCPTAAQAIEKVKEMIPAGATVTWGGSMTLRDMGLTRALHEAGTYQLFDRDLAQSAEEAQEIYRKAFSADFYLSSANALSEDGVIVNIDGNGNRVAAITFGPKQVIFVISLRIYRSMNGKVTIFQFCLYIFFLRTRDIHRNLICAILILDICTHQIRCPVTSEWILKKVIKYIVSKNTRH